MSAIGNETHIDNRKLYDSSKYNELCNKIHNVICKYNINSINNIKPNYIYLGRNELKILIDNYNHNMFSMNTPKYAYGLEVIEVNKADHIGVGE